MRVWPAIVAFLVLLRPAVAAQANEWQIDIAGAALAEAWDLNENRERLTGLAAGVENRLWRTLRLRVEVWFLRSFQDGPDSWVRGFDVGPRWRWGTGSVRPFADVGVGLSDATVAVPPGGTRFNFVARAG